MSRRPDTPAAPPAPESVPGRRRFASALAAGVSGLAGLAATRPEPEAGYEGGLTDIAGLEVGHFTDSRRPTGCTVVLAAQGAACGVDVRGGAPGTRETDLLRPDNLVEQIHGLVLAGGSAFGLDAASGVMRWLEERGRGFAVGKVRVPIVPAAILFDLELGDPSIRPDAAAGYAAAHGAGAGPVAEGNVGAGAGATVGKLFGGARAMKGGLGSAATRVPGGPAVAALVAVNAVGDVLDPATGRLLAGARRADGSGLEGTAAALAAGRLLLPNVRAGENTTLAVVATDTRLDKAGLTRVAEMAHDGLARAIEPAHTPWDGDTVFAISTAAREPSSDAELLVIGAVAARVLARAVVRAVLKAQGLPGLPSASDLRG